MVLLRETVRRCSCAVMIACSLASLSCGDCVETPSIASITPTSAVAGSSQLVLIVNGNHFQRTSVINWNAATRPTTFVNDHQLKAMITAEDLAAPAVVKVTVLSPPQSQPVMLGGSTTSTATTSTKADCAGGTSNAFNFTVSS